MLMRINDERKIWKLSKLDLDSYSRWYDYSRARDDMFAATDTSVSPWFVAQSDDKKKARLNCIHHLLKQMPYGEVERPTITLPERVRHEGYRRHQVPGEIHVPKVY